MLRDVCVVDVDSLELAAHLEATFPVLADAPCAATARGKHCYFRRPPRADELRVFDGAASGRQTWISKALRHSSRVHLHRSTSPSP